MHSWFLLVLPLDAISSLYLLYSYWGRGLLSFCETCHRHVIAATTRGVDCVLTHCSAAGSSRGAPYTDHADRRHPHQQREQQDSIGSELDSGAQREVPTRNHE